MNTVANRFSLVSSHLDRLSRAPLLLALVLLFPGLQPSLRGAETNEQQLIQVLQSKAALMDKDAACVQLKRIGTARSVPALAALLTDEQLSQSARYALEAMTFKAILATHPSAGQKRLVLAGLAGIPDPGSLKLVEPMLEDAAVQAEAARAVIKLASALPDWTMALAALNKVLAVTQEPATRSDAQAAIKQLDTGAGFINAWQVAGPYREAGKDYTALFDTAFPLETSGTQDVNWRALAGADARRPGIMDLLKALGGQECVAYARASIHCDREQAARLELGSDDGVKVWLNQKLVHAKNVARALRPGSDKVNVALNAGLP